MYLPRQECSVPHIQIPRQPEPEAVHEAWFPDPLWALVQTPGRQTNVQEREAGEKGHGY